MKIKRVQIRKCYQDPPEFVMDNIMSLRDERSSRYLTREMLAEITCVHPHSIRHYENMRHWPTLANYNRLASFFNWPLWIKEKK